MKQGLLIAFFVLALIFSIVPSSTLAANKASKHQLMGVQSNIVENIMNNPRYAKQANDIIPSMIEKKLSDICKKSNSIPKNVEVEKVIKTVIAVDFMGEEYTSARDYKVGMGGFPHFIVKKFECEKSSDHFAKVNRAISATVQ